MGLHLALQEESGAETERKKSSMMRLLPRKGLFPGGRATLRGDDLQLSEERTVHIPKVPGCKTSHAQCLIQCRYQGLGLLWAALLGPGAGRVLEHTGQGEGNTHRPGFWALVALPPAAPQGGAAPALLAVARQQHLFLGYFCSQFIPCLLELL